MNAFLPPYVQPDTSFENWTRLTDALAHQLSLMHRGEPGARGEAWRLAEELRELNTNFGNRFGGSAALLRHGGPAIDGGANDCSPDP